MSVKSWFVLGVLCLPFAAQAGPKIEHWQTTNGAEVYFVAAPELPIVDVQVVFDAGSARDGEKSGVGLLTSGLIDDGAKTANGELGADEIAERFADLGALFGAGADRDTTTVSLRSLSDPRILQPALDTMALLISQPTFPESSFERERKLMLIGLQAQEQSPEGIASKAFYKALYGNHPYATQPLGNVESVNKLTRADVIAHHKRYYVADNAVVAIVGALDHKAAVAVAEAVVGKLPKGSPPAPLPAVAPLSVGSTQTIAFPSAQTHILMGEPGITRDDPDYFPLLVGNHVLGGSGLVSRLSGEIREKRGLSYSTYSYFAPMQVKGPYTLGLATQNEQTTKALEVLRDTLQKFVQSGATAKELDEAKQNITGGFALRLDSNSKVAGYLATIGFYGLPLDYLDTYTGKVENVTLKQIQDAFTRRIHPEQMVTVVVGGPQTQATAVSGEQR